MKSIEAFFLVVGTALALAFIVAFTRVLLRGSASRYWRQGRGTVRRVVIECTTERGELDRFVARIDYEYEFDGARRRNGEFVGQTCTDREEAVRYAHRYTAGQQVDVFVDPAKPTESTLNPGLKYQYLIPVLFGIGMLVFCLGRLFG